MVVLDDTFNKAWAGRDPFAAARALDGQTFRHVKARRTLRFELDGKSYFAKIHGGVGWSEIVKNLLMLKKPILGAANEYAAIRRLEALGVPTMTVAAFGERGANPAGRESFIVTRELTETEDLESFCREWPHRPPPVPLKRALIAEVARMSRTLHSHGVNHRDFYICHFLLDISGGRDNVDPEKIRLWLIDLHRAQLRARLPMRWRVKDVAGLYFSAMDIGLTQRDLFRFMRLYSGSSLRETLRADGSFWLRVKRAAQRLHAREQRKPRG